LKKEFLALKIISKENQRLSKALCNNKIGEIYEMTFLSRYTRYPIDLRLFSRTNNSTQSKIDELQFEIEQEKKLFNSTLLGCFPFFFNLYKISPLSIGA